jgi:hypothetical protein
MTVDVPERLVFLRQVIKQMQQYAVFARHVLRPGDSSC